MAMLTWKPPGYLVHFIVIFFCNVGIILQLNQKIMKICNTPMLTLKSIYFSNVSDFEKIHSCSAIKVFSWRSKFFKEHSQITATRHPIFLNSDSFLLSRRTLAVILLVQNSFLVEGNLDFGQPRWLCQKQPCTKITTWCFGRTMSGFPGCFEWSLYLKPPRQRAFRITSSGVVFLPCSVQQ